MHSTSFPSKSRLRPHRREGRSTLGFLLVVFLLEAAQPMSSQVCPPPPPLSPPWLTIPAQPFQHHLWVDGNLMSANVYVHDTGLQAFRPFVFVEGIDFGLSSGMPPHRNGDFGWAQFLGCDMEAYPMMADTPVLLDSLIQRGFTPVLVDFGDGTADLFDNAALLTDILRHLREHRTDPRPMVVSGASMGGQLACIALRQMELHGDPTCTSLFVSLDSPHQGANVPLGLQHLLNFLAPNGSELLQNLVGALQSPAARQLLVRQTTSLSARHAYQDSLDLLGLPQDARTVSIANGGLHSLPGLGTPLLLYDHAVLESDWLGDVGNLLRLHVHAFPGWEDHPDATPATSVTTDVHIPSASGWPWPLQEGTGLCDPEDLTEFGPLDRLPGGTRPSMLQFMAAFNAHIADLDLPWPISIPPIEEDEITSHHSFIPTLSAVAIPPPWTSNIGEGLLEVSPFDAIHVAESNEPHSEINPANIAFLLDQLDLAEPPLPPGTTVVDTTLTASDSWRLSAVDVHGHLALHPAEFDTVSGTPEPAFSADFVLDGCSGPLSVLSSGTLELGTSGPSPSPVRLRLDHTAALQVHGQLVIRQGSELVIESDAELHLENGALILEPGARLALQSGALMRLSGNVLWAQQDSAITQLDGHVFVGPDAEWPVQLLGSARFTTTGNASIQCAPGSHVAMHSASEEGVWLLGTGAHVSIDGHGHWTWDGMGIRMAGDGRFSASSSHGQTWSSFWTGATSDSLFLEGNVSLHGHVTGQVHLAQATGIFQASDSEFEGGSTHSSGRLNLERCAFRHHPVIHESPMPCPAHVIQDCHFEDGTIGIQSASTSTLRLEDCRFDRLALATSLVGMRCELGCCTFMDNDVAVLANRSLLAMTPLQGGGWNRFEDNDVHLRFNQAPLPLWSDGANFFGNWGSAWGQGSFSLACSGPVDVDASGQAWNSPISWPQVQSGLWAVPPDGEPCPIQILDLAPVPVQPCRLNEKRKRE